MNEHTTFVGMGINPDGPELPLGFSMQLAQNMQAMDNYGKLTKQQQESVINYIKSSTSGIDAHNRIYDTVLQLAQNNLSFIR